MPVTDPIGSERLEALLAGDPPRTPAEEHRASLVADLRGGALRAPEALRERVLRPASSRRRLPRRVRPSRRRALVLVSVALALALVAAAVHGVVAPAPRLATPSVETAASSAKAAPAPRAAAPRQGDTATAGRSRSARMLDGKGYRPSEPRAPIGAATSGAARRAPRARNDRRAIRAPGADLVHRRTARAPSSSSAQ